jgi:putative CocE/NonD family hydrolase
MRCLDPVWIPLSDGCRLAATLWLPDSDEPVPGILEYLPYRRRDGTALRDAGLHPALADAGYACLRVDMRGTGDSDGALADEYLPQEQADAIEVIAWIAVQPWCSGTVGMMGISWGGFNALQVAAHRPPALKAIITLCSTDDRYTDDTHYMGGCLLTGNLTWGSVMLSTSAFPPDPAIVGERWREMWLDRLANQPLLAAIWTEHQRRDAYWRQGSVCEDFSTIQCAVLAIGGWADAYTNAVGRLLAGLKTPRRGLIGPWSHAYPHIAQPGPAIDFLGEAALWWDHWLKGRDNGAMTGPVLRAWIQDSTPPAARQAEVPGRWIAEPVWPPAESRDKLWYLAAGGLVPSAGSEQSLGLVCSPQDVGLASGAWCGYGLSDGPSDQRIDDGRSIVFATPPLDAPLPVLGTPTATLDIVAHQSIGTLAVRLLDIAPGGASTRVSYGLLALSHQASDAEPSPLTPGERTSVTIRLNDIGWRFLAGHRIAIAMSTAYWPTAWPGPDPLTVELFSGGTLALPIRPDRAEDFAPSPFAAPPRVVTLPNESRRPPDRGRGVHLDLTNGTTTLVAQKDRGAFHLTGIDLEVDARGVEHFSIAADDPLSARVETEWACAMRRGEWVVSSEAKVTMTADRSTFHIAATLVVREGASIVSDRTWSVCIPRDQI